MNGQQKAQGNVEKFREWALSQSPEELKQIIHRGQLNRGEIAKACGFAKSVLRQNPTVKSDLEQFEEELRGAGVLPPLAAKEDKPTELYDQNATKALAASNKASKLENEVIALRAENEQLRAQLRRYRELGEVMTDIGMIPQ